MRWSLSDRSYPELVFGLYAVVVILALIAAASTSGAAFGAFTSSWEGTSDLRGEAASSDAELHIVTETDQYDEVPANGSVALVLSPEEGYTAEDRDRLRTFVENGGTLVVANAFGPHGNPLLEGVGATAQFEGDPLRDEQHYYRSPSLPVATNVGDHPYVARSDGITLNQGTAIDPGEATVLVASSEYGYLDHDRNRELDDDETLEPYPVVTAEEVGDGRVIAVSDASVFINAMLERPGNRAFANGLFASHERVLFDTSHRPDVPPTALAVLSLRDSAALQAVLGGGLLLSIALAQYWPSIRKAVDRARSRNEAADRTGLSEAEMDRLLRDRYPHWDADRRDVVTTTVTSGREDETHD